ncbi:MAG: bifunctional (p)ppGpp synthetase/guanosine-3',5'-bis(diphosphate) 3'-pyrophosphohydrolase [Betaproteobacteria bacterium]|nr:bifunctional (p)ppGpp synthetase/guanosine-3',5'-bis(diphosphate) 3'-pyrophosphohydrolase [Betaproteobacteria bacterium]
MALTLPTTGSFCSPSVACDNSIMVQVPEIATPAGIDPKGWVAALPLKLAGAEAEVLERAIALALPAYGERRLRSGEPIAAHALAMATILAGMRLDHETLAAAILFAVPECLEGHAERFQAATATTVQRLVEGVTRMGQIQTLTGGAGAEHAAQAEALRKMLLAMAEDVRVVLIKLADRIQILRFAAGREAPGRAEAARETLDIFAPLANRLGVWQAKWELEDLAFRILEPELYKDLARKLDERRADRERYIADVIALLRRELAAAGLSRVEISGRPKHIYSIYKKMRRKQVGFEEIYDARAVRVLVNDLKDCYTALGVVHNLWTPIPKEFDDYIAKPKGNHYRSLHTAVIGPEGKALEVQIRSFDMHQHAELGVAAHWRYKESGRHDARYDEKIAWLRQILDWKEDMADAQELAEQFKTALFEDTVYVLTPQGRVIDLPKGSTPVDFAYHVHSDLGHRCRGAKVDGVMVPLNYPLKNAQRVEITAAKQGGPSRDWLNPALGFLKSSRGRAKVRQWFKALELEQTIAEGRATVERELQRQGLTALALEKVAEKFKFTKAEEFLLAVARGEINTRQLAEGLGGQPAAAVPEQELHLGRQAAQPQGSGILIVGVDRLLTVLAKCCKPAPPDPIVGFVTRGRGVAIHRAGCPNVAQLSPGLRERLVAADWGRSEGSVFPVDIEVEASDRQGLLRDISDVLSREKVNVIAANTLSRNNSARMFFTLEVANVEQLRRVLALIHDVSGVQRAGRRG